MWNITMNMCEQTRWCSVTLLQKIHIFSPLCARPLAWSPESPLRDIGQSESSLSNPARQTDQNAEVTRYWVWTRNWSVRGRDRSFRIQVPLHLCYCYLLFACHLTHHCSQWASTPHQRFAPDSRPRKNQITAEQSTSRNQNNIYRIQINYSQWCTDISVEMPSSFPLAFADCLFLRHTKKKGTEKDLPYEFTPRKYIRQWNTVLVFLLSKHWREWNWMCFSGVNILLAERPWKCDNFWLLLGQGPWNWDKL